MDFKCEFWSASSGNQPVKEFLKEVTRNSPKAVAKISKVNGLLEEKGLQFMMQNGYVDKFKNEGIYEIKVEFNKIQYRIFGVLKGSKFHLLLGFIKKGQKTPPQHLATAVARAKTIK